MTYSDWNRNAVTNGQGEHVLRRSIVVRSTVCLLVAIQLFVVTSLVATVWGDRDGEKPTKTDSSSTEAAVSLSRAAEASDAPEFSSTARPKGAHASQVEQPPGVTIHRPSRVPRVATGTLGWDGQPLSVRCKICHANRPPNLANRSVDDLDEFHSNLKLHHGNLSCLSCHNPEDYESLRLADGSRVEFHNVIKLCGQCHGKQWSDYQHGLHGGMQGYWDASRGGKQKNNCIDCHYPHAPQFPRMYPTFKPRDRFLDPPHEGGPRSEFSPSKAAPSQVK